MNVRIFQTATLKFVTDLGPATRVFDVDVLDPRSACCDGDHQRALRLDRVDQFAFSHVLLDATAVFTNSRNSTMRPAFLLAALRRIRL